VRRRYWGSRRYQRKICGQENGAAITVGHQTRLYLKIQEVLLYVTSHTDRPTIVLDSKTGRVTPLNRPLYSILKFFQVDSAGMLRMTSSARYFKEGVGSRRPN
jgi:hypothetical protein